MFRTYVRSTPLTLCLTLAATAAFAQPRPPGLQQPQQRPRQVAPQVQPAQPAQPARPQGQQIRPSQQQPAAAPATPEEAERRRATCREIARKARFNIYFDKVEIEKLVQTVSDATCKTFILPENVRGKISIIGPENGKVEVNSEQFYRAFLAALDANGLAVYETGQFAKIVDKRNAKQTPIPTIGPDGRYTTAEQMVTKMFKVKYVDIEPLRGVLQQLVSQNGDTIPFPPDVIIVNDVGSNLHRLERIIKQLDSRSSSDEMRIIQINYANAQEIADKIQKLFQPQGTSAQAGARGRGRTNAPAARPVPGAQAAAPAATGGEEGGAVSVSQIIPDERTNKLIVIASPAGFERIEELVKMLDVPIPGEGRINVYYLENADAEDMAGTLQSLAQGTSARPGRAAAPAIAAGGAQRGAPQAAELFSGEVKISADKGTNSLVIIASQADYRNMIRVIEKLDVPRKQVFIEAVIMEVNVDRKTGLGARLHGGYGLKTNDGTMPVVVGTKFGEQIPPSFNIANLTSFGGFLAGLQGPTTIPIEGLGINIPAFGIVLHAMQESSDVNVLSTPHILTTDNEEAEISVGQNVPFQAGVAPGALGGLAGIPGGTTGGTNPALAAGLFSSFVTPINRQNVELKLTVKPQINESDFVRLVISEQTEEIAARDQVLGPTTAKRTIKTTVVARDQETVVLGGIMQDRTIESVAKVPILGDLPILGHLFREENRQKVKTNLLLFLTPYIIKEQSDFRRIFERKMKERQQFVEAFYGQVPGYEVTIDFDRKKGPLSEIHENVRREQKKIDGDRVIGPTNGRPVGGAPTMMPRAGQPEAAPADEGAPAEGAPEAAPEDGEVSPPPEGSSEVAPTPPPPGERPEEQLRVNPPTDEIQ